MSVTRGDLSNTLCHCYPEIDQKMGAISTMIDQLRPQELCFCAHPYPKTNLAMQHDNSSIDNACN
jgi:hypothetical protein